MTVLDTFYLLFKTDAAGAKDGIASLDKQIDELSKKGKSRDDQENKRYAELKKQRKEQLDQTKEQKRAVDKLGDSFESMITSAVGAVAGFATFGAIKAGLVDVNNLNASLLRVQQTYGKGVSAPTLKGLAQNVEAKTGIPAQAIYDFVTQNAAAQQGSGLPFDQLQSLINLRTRYKNFSAEELNFRLKGLPGGAALIPLIRKESTSDETFKQIIDSARNSTPAQFQAALNIEKSAADRNKALGQVATDINQAFLKPIQIFNDAVKLFAEAIQGHPLEEVGAGIGAIAGVALFVKGLGSLAAAALKAGLRGIVGIASGGATVGTGAGAGEVAAAGAAGTGLLATGGLIAAGTGAGLAAKSGISGLFDILETFWLTSQLRRGGGTVPAGGLPAKAGSNASRRQQVIDAWKAQGYTSGQAQGWAANAQAESNFGLDPRTNLNGHFGIYQWSSRRRADILKGTGIDVATASVQDQVKAAAWEAGRYGITPSTLSSEPGQAAATVSNRFEVPSLTQAGLANEAAHRARIAEGYGPIPTSSQLATDVGGAPGKTINIKIDDIKIETQATDSAGIAREVSAELKNQIRMAMSNIDDGVQS